MVFCFFYLYIYIYNVFNYLFIFLFFSGTISRIWNETWLSSFFYKPCNYELFVKQSLNMEMAIVMARVWKIVFSCISFLFFFFFFFTSLSQVNFSQYILLHIKTSGCWHGLDNSSWHWWVITPSWCSGVFTEAAAAWCAWECGYGYIS